MDRRFAAAAALAALSLSACSGSPAAAPSTSSAAAAPSPSSSAPTTVTPLPPVTTAPAPPATTTAPATATAEPTATTPLTPAPTPPAAATWPTGPVNSPFTGQVPPLPTLVAVRVGAHPEGGYDRIAMDFRQTAAPGYTVRYVSQVVRDGSGLPVSLPGGAYLQIVFYPAAAHTDAGQSTLVSPPVNPRATGFPGLKSYVLNGDFEGHVSIAIGQAAMAGFHINRLHQPNGLWTIYLDVPRP